jgi:transaldolase
MSLSAATKPTQTLHELGQSLWLDNITRDILNDGTLQYYIDELSVTGLTSNPTIFDEALGQGVAYDQEIQALARRGLVDEGLFTELALSDLRRAADRFRPIYDETAGRDGWVSMEVSPLLINDTQATVAAAASIHKSAGKPNLYVKIPGSMEGVKAIQETLVAGIPVNVTLLFSREQYLRVADAYMNALQLRIDSGLSPQVSSVASLFVSRWDKAVADKVPAALRNRLGILMAKQTYQAYGEVLQSDRWRGLAALGAKPQRLLWASTGTKDPNVPADLYVSALAAPDTINTMPAKTLLAFSEKGSVDAALLKTDRSIEAEIMQFTKVGIDLSALASQLQREGGDSFVKSWRHLLGQLRNKTESLVPSSQ